MPRPNVVYFAPEGSTPPTDDDGAGRLVSLAPDGVTRYEPLGTIDSTGLREDR